MSGGKIGDMALHFLNKYGLMAVRLTSKWDVRRLCKSVGATPLPKLTTPTKVKTYFMVVSDDRLHEVRTIWDTLCGTPGETSRNLSKNTLGVILLNITNINQKKFSK